MDNLIFCLNATVPIFAIIVLGRWLRSKNFFTKQSTKFLPNEGICICQSFRFNIGYIHRNAHHLQQSRNNALATTYTSGYTYFNRH